MNRKITTFTLGLVGLMSIGMTSSAQSLIDGFMQGKNKGNIALSYTYDAYKKFYKGTQKVPEVPALKRITQNIISLYANYGITNNLDAVLNIPYIASRGHGQPDPFSKQTRANGLQDLSLFLKYRLFNASNDQGQFSGMVAAGFSTPLSNYEPNAILSIGNHATAADGKALLQYKFSCGLFVTLQGGYSIRSDKVPNATLLQAKVGFAAAKFYVAGYIFSQISDKNAPDINPPTVPFQETRVNYTATGITVFIPVSPAFGVSAGASAYVAGRNVGLAKIISVGVDYRIGH